MYHEYSDERYKILKKYAKQLGAHTAYTKEAPEYCDLYNGITVAFIPAFEGPDCRMLQVSVSYCALDDKFKKKIGKYHALRKLIDERELVQLPLAEYYRDNGAEETAEILLGIFTV
jgi:hypothetical protein